MVLIEIITLETKQKIKNLLRGGFLVFFGVFFFTANPDGHHVRWHAGISIY